MKNKFLLTLIILLAGLTVFSQSLQLTSLSPDVFCGTGRDTMKFSVNYTNIPQNSNIVFYQSTNPAFNPYGGQGDSIGFINVGANTSGGGGQITTTCPEIIGIFFDACNNAPYAEANNEYVVITSGNAGVQVNNLVVRLPNTSINTGTYTFVTPPAAMMNLLRTGTCTNTTLLPASNADFIPPNAIVIIFTLNGNGVNPVFPYNFSSYCSSGQPIYILLNSNTSGTASFLNAVQPPGTSCPNVYRTTTIQYGGCRDDLTYAPCSLPLFDINNPNAGDGNYAIHLSNTDTSSLTNGGIRNNSSDKCNGIRFDSISGATIIKFPIPNDGSANPVTNFCNTGYHYIKAITHPNGSQPVSNTIQYKLICLDVTTNVTNLSFCSGGNAAVNISSTDPNASFSWTVSGGAGITGASAGTGSTINQTLNYSGATKDSLTYNITATDGICSKNTSVKVVVNKCNSCNAFNLGKDTTYCSSFLRTLKTGNATSVWNTGVTADSITVSSPGTYFATCGAFTDTIVIKKDTTARDFNFGTNSTSICKNGTISLDASTAFDSYIWNTGALTHSITIASPGKYWVDVSKIGCKGTDTILVIEIDKEPKPNLGTDITVCSPVSQQLSTGNANTTWYITSTANQVGTGANYTATQFGKFIAKVSNSCGDVFDTIEIKQTSTQQPFNLGRDTSFCGSFSDTLRTGNAATVWSTGATAAFIVVTTPGKYYATINVGCGIASDTINITQGSSVSFDFGFNSTSVCVGGNINLGAGNTFDSYKWNTGAVTNSISITQPGIYWVDVFKNGCKASDTISVIQIDKEPKPNLGRDSTYCGNFSRILSTGNAQTQWFKNNSSIPFTTSASVTVDQTTPGTYVAKITNSCGSVADTVVISSANALNVNLGRDTAICNGSSLTLRATVPGASISYLWNTGAVTPTISVNQFGKYDVAVSNGNCTVTDTIFVDVVDKPTIISLGNDTTICGDFSLQLFTGDAGTIWSSGEVGSQITITKPATYIAENKNVCGSAKDTIVVTQFAIPVVNLGKDTTICDSVVLSVGNGSFATILWNTGDTTPSIVVTASGVYQVKVSNTNCVNSDSVKVTKDCFYDVYIPTAFSPNGDTINDIYVPISDIKGMLVIDFVVFDRWGEKVFESQNFVPRDATKGWDGTFKGEPAQQDNYVYFFTARMPDGEVKVYKGTFALLR